MYDPVKVYKSQKKANWINHQLAQKLIVFCYIDSRLVVIKRAKVEDESVVINGEKNLKLKTQPIYSTKADITNPIGTFKEQPLSATESADLICKCIW
jgi:hypothetical protein